MIDAEEPVRQVFKKKSDLGSADIFRGVICDFIEGEALNLKKGSIIAELGHADYEGFYFETNYNSRDGSARALEDMPNEEIKKAVLVEYDKKLNPSGMLGDSKEAKSAQRSKSRFVDFSLLTVATISASRRKRQSIIVSRDRWMKLSCKSLEEKFKLPIYCYDQWNFSVEEILGRSQRK